MDGLNETFQAMRNFAKGIDYENLSVNDLANGYCDAADRGDEAGKNAYISALTLRFWYKIGRLAQENQTLRLTREDAFTWLTSAIMDACDPKARAWRREGSRTGAQQAINQVLATRYVAAAYYDSNLKKNQGKAFMVSLDSPLGEDGKQTLCDTLTDGTTASPGGDGSVAHIIQEYIDRDKLVEAIIIDNIAGKDVFRHERETIETIGKDGEKEKISYGTAEFWPFRLVKELAALDDSYAAGFLSTYAVSEKAFEAAFKAIKKANNQKKYRMIDETLTDLRRVMPKS